jgi:uncharacterized protein (TIGR02145 family)
LKIVSSIILVCSLIILGAANKSQAQCSTGYSQIIVNIVPDSYPAETSWNIKDASNTIIASGTTNSDTLCYLTGNLLHFTIYDSYGDGICCGWGNGSYNVYIDGNLIATGGQFTFSETTFFNYPPGYVSTTLINAYQQLTDHCNNIALLSPAQINSLADSIHKYYLYLADTLPVISAAFDLINCYETNTGPVFLNASTTGGFPNAPGALDGFEYDRAIFLVQQELFEVLYSKVKIAKYRTFLQGRKYLTSDYFPGVCPLPADSSQVYIATVNASMPANWGKPTAWCTSPARRPTGYYLAPGSIGKVKVPDIMVNAGYKILVGAHPLKNSNMNPILRFFRIFNTYDITDTVTLIANPFGGGIYIITPYQASAGLQQVELTNVVPAPFFSAKSYDATTISEWQNVQRNNPAPWADFESEKFMMQVPTSFIYNYSDPVTLMADWDARMDVVSNLLGYPLVRNNQVLYVMLDVVGMGYGGYGIGNPQINNIYSAYDAQNGNSQMWFLVPGAAHMWESEFHELGHAQLMEKFPGEAEAIVNVLSAAIFNELYGVDIDSAFGWSFDNEYWRSRDQSAINWMVTHNFRAGNPMDISNTTKDEVRYQHRGYGKYIEIAALFGWEALESYYQQVNLDYNNGVPPGPLGQTDDRILKMSKKAGVDLRPLIHFWGVHPQDSAALAQAIDSNNLLPSTLICNRLMHYQSIIPMDSAQFSQHALVYFNGPVPPGGDPDYENGWYNVWLPLYNNSHGDSAVAAMQKIIDTYFPNGCSCTNLNLPQVTNTQLSKTICSLESTNITLSSNFPGTMFHWSASLTSGNITGLSSDSGLVINQVLVNQIASPGIVSYHVTPKIGTCSGIPVDFTVTVNPRDSVKVSVSASVNNICSGTPVTFTATPTNPGTAPGYQWKVNGVNAGSNSPDYTYSPYPGDLITCVMTSSVACPAGNPATSNTIAMIVNTGPPAGITITATPNPFCPGRSVTFTATPGNGGSSPVYQWKVNGVSAGTNTPSYTYNPLNNDSVRCVMTSNLACVSGNPASSNTVILSGSLAPVVTFATCFDTITTTNAKPIRLKGGIPLGGTYSGAGVSNGFYYPSIAGAGTHIITYNYTNAAMCSASAHSSVHQFISSSAPCGTPLNDIRDGKIYPTIQIGTQCWMAANLNYGTMISSSAHQRDNCINEKYCYQDLIAMCNSQGANYQWDEMMRYDDTPGLQGICPPGWHVPAEAEWKTLFAFYTNNGFAGSPLKYSGYSGFNALLSGVSHSSRQWDFNNFATFLWSSTAYDTYKAWAHGINDYSPSVSFYPSSKGNAFLIRCLKD